MSIRDRTNWELFVDESGNFGSARDDISVCGVLARADLPGLRPDSLRVALERVAPWLPWPPHVAHLNTIVLIPLAFVAAHERGVLADPGRAPSTVRRLARQRPAEVASALDALRAHALPEYDDLEALRGPFAHLNKGTRMYWSEIANETRAYYGRLLAGLAASPLDGAAPPHIFVVTSGETRRGDAGATADARYRESIEALFERIGDIVDRFDGEHRVRLNVSQLDVYEPILGRRVKLHVRHLGEIVRRLSPELGDRVRLVPATVSAYFTPDVHPAFVLADLVANRARPVLARSVPLARAEADLVTSLRAPVRSGTPRRSHLAATGISRTYVASHRRGDCLPDLDSGALRRWAREQAVEWSS